MSAPVLLQRARRNTASQHAWLEAHTQFEFAKRAQKRLENPILYRQDEGQVSADLSRGNRRSRIPKN